MAFRIDATGLPHGCQLCAHVVRCIFHIVQCLAYVQWDRCGRTTTTPICSLSLDDDGEDRKHGYHQQSEQLHDDDADTTQHMRWQCGSFTIMLSVVMTISLLLMVSRKLPPGSGVRMTDARQTTTHSLSLWYGTVLVVQVPLLALRDTHSRSFVFPDLAWRCFSTGSSWAS